MKQKMLCKGQSQTRSSQWLLPAKEPRMAMGQSCGEGGIREGETVGQSEGTNGDGLPSRRL